MSQSTGSPSGRKQTLIEDDTEFRGVLSSKCPIVVKGTVDGEVSGPSLQVSQSGAVSGTVKVTELRSSGTLSGTIEADQVQLSGTVKDKTVLRAKSLEVKLAPARGKMELTFGECELEVGEVPAKEEAVKDALAPATEAAPAEAPAEESAKDPEKTGEPSEGAAGEKAEAGAQDGADDGADGKKKRRARRESTSPPPGP